MKYLSNNDIANIIEFVRAKSIEAVAENLLFLLGFKSNLLGTGYLKEAIVLRYTVEKLSLCKNVYVQIAQKHNSTPSRVERGIRHSIMECHDSGKLARLNDLINSQVIDSNFVPTNNELLCVLCTWIHIERESA